MNIICFIYYFILTYIVLILFNNCWIIFYIIDKYVIISDNLYENESKGVISDVN
jgi:hypothetical protein